MAKHKPIDIDEYVRQVIEKSQIDHPNERFISVYILLQEIIEKAKFNATEKTKSNIISMIKLKTNEQPNRH